MMHRRKFLIALLAAPASAAAQDRRFRIGWLVFGDASLGPIDRSLRDSLAQRGLTELAAELAAQKPDMLLAVGGDVVKALFDASKSGIPIVGGVSDNPVRAGMVVSLA